MREDELESDCDGSGSAPPNTELLAGQLSRLASQLEKLEERFKSHDDRLAGIETNQTEIIVKLSELQTIIESHADRSDPNNNNDNININHTNRLQLCDDRKIHQSLFDDERGGSPVPLGGEQQAALNQQEANSQQDQNNNNCSSRMSAASSSMNSSPSMSPIEPNTHTPSHHQSQQSQQNSNNNNNNNNNSNTHQHLHQHRTSLHHSLLQNLQQQHPELVRRASLQHQFHAITNHQHAHNNNGGQANSATNNGQLAVSRHSSASVSPSLGHSALSTSANSPMMGSPANSLGGHLSGPTQQHQHAQQSNGVGGSQHHLATAQQILQAAAAAQQHQHNSQQQDPNMAALAASQFLSALGQLGASQGVGCLGDTSASDAESLLAQSRLLASTLSAAAAANAGAGADLGSQMAAAVVAAAAKSGATLPGGLNLGHHSNGASAPNHQTGGPAGAPTGQSSPLIPCQNHLLASHNANSNNNNNNNNNANNNNNNQQNPHSHSTGSSPVSAAAAMAAQLSAVAAAAAHHQQQQQHQHSAGQQLSALPLTSSSGLTSSPFLNGAGGGHAVGLASSQANSVANGGQLVHSIPHPHSHHALSHPSSASLLMNNPHYQTVRTKYSTRRYSRRRVGPEEAMADPAIRATAQLKMPVVPKTILIVLRHRLTVQTAITLACARTGERLRKGAIQKKLEAMFREPGAVDAFLNEWDHPNAGR